MKEVIIVSGMSGAGKTTAMGFLEDLGYYCVDNVPGSVLDELLKLFLNSNLEKLALVVDVRSEALGDPVGSVRRLKENRELRVIVVFLEASKETLVKRFAFTRRKHPLQRNDVGLEEAIDKERELLAPLREIADHVVDTTNLTTHQLRGTLGQLLGRLEEKGVVRIISFGYKYGIPTDVDFVFDVRFLPNPYYVPGLSQKTGLDEEVEDFLKNYPLVEEYVMDMYRILKKAVDSYFKEGKKIVSVGIGCTGGRHRSVYVARKLSEILSEEGIRTVEIHRDIEKV